MEFERSFDRVLAGVVSGVLFESGMKFLALCSLLFLLYLLSFSSFHCSSLFVGCDVPVWSRSTREEENRELQIRGLETLSEPAELQPISKVTIIPRPFEVLHLLVARKLSRRESEAFADISSWIERVFGIAYAHRRQVLSSSSPRLTRHAMTAFTGEEGSVTRAKRS